MKTIIFVDGQNLFYSLKDMDLFERQINWDAFFGHCLEEGDDFIRAYWYQAEKINNPRLDFYKAWKKIDKLHPDSTEEEKKRLARILLKTATDWTNEQKERYERQLHLYDEFAISWPKIEMVRKGLLKIDPFKQEVLGEKGIDVALAVNMIKFHTKCDKIVLISGDLDYAEAVQYVKDNMKRVHIVRLHRGEPPINRSVSRTLMALADRVIDFYETDIKAKFLNANP